MKWVTRSHVHVDRVACPWLILRFVDNEAEFLFVPRSQVEKVVAETGAIPFDEDNLEYQLEVYDALYAWCRLDVERIKDKG